MEWLCVITTDGINDMVFRVRFYSKLLRFKRVYCNRFSLKYDEVRFIYDGQRISNDDTPASLKMDNDDVIEIYQEIVV